jgi:hypothetical protein
MMKAIFFLVGLHAFSYCHSQTVMTADRTQVLIGDQVKATITTNLSQGKEWRNLENVWPDSIPGIEVVSGPEIDNKNPASARYTWIVSVFDTGWVRIPSLPVVIRDGNRLDTFMTNDIPIEVLIVEPDSTGLAGIKDIVRQPFSLWYYRKYWPHLLILLALLLGAYVWWRKRNRPEELVEEMIPEPLPHEWALQELAVLEERKLWQQGEVKEHYTLLTGIFREYLERLYGIQAKEQTTDEILHQLSFQDLRPELLNDTGELLSVADLIKFAKADPGTDIHAATIERVRRFIRETMVIPAPSESLTADQDETVE